MKLAELKKKELGLDSLQKESMVINIPPRWKSIANEVSSLVSDMIWGQMKNKELISDELNSSELECFRSQGIEIDSYFISFRTSVDVPGFGSCNVFRSKQGTGVNLSCVISLNAEKMLRALSSIRSDDWSNRITSVIIHELAHALDPKVIKDRLLGNTKLRADQGKTKYWSNSYEQSAFLTQYVNLISSYLHSHEYSLASALEFIASSSPSNLFQTCGIKLSPFFCTFFYSLDEQEFGGHAGRFNPDFSSVYKKINEQINSGEIKLNPEHSSMFYKKLYAYIKDLYSRADRELSGDQELYAKNNVSLGSIKIGEITEEYDKNLMKEQLKSDLISNLKSNSWYYSEEKNEELRSKILDLFSVLDLTDFNSKPDIQSFMELIQDDLYSDFLTRDMFVKFFSWSFLDSDTIEEIVKFSSGQVIKDFMSGSGYIAYLLSKAGGNVQAFDVRYVPDSTGRGKFIDYPRKNWYPIEEKKIEEQVLSGSEVVLLSWVPCGSDIANEVLNQMVVGQKLILIGEGWGGCTGSDNMHEIISKDFEHQDTLELISWRGIHDNVNLYVKKQVKTDSILPRKESKGSSWYKSGSENNDPKDEDEIYSDDFMAWFAGSKVLDAQGEPLAVYHGSGTSFDSFDFEFTGKGNDQLGSGFYFTNLKQSANGYTEPDEEKKSRGISHDGTPTVLTVYLSIKKPLDVRKVGSIPASKIKAIILKSPNLAERLEDWDENPTKALIKAVDSYARMKAPIIKIMNTLSHDFYGNGEDIKILNETFNQVLGYDGVTGTGTFFNGDDETYWVAWFPSQIRIVKKEPVVQEPNTKIDNGQNNKVVPDIVPKDISDTNKSLEPKESKNSRMLKTSAFRSKLIELLRTKIPSKIYPQQLSGIVNNIGPNQDERKWSGIDDLISELDPTEKYDKNWILKQLESRYPLINNVISYDKNFVFQMEWESVFDKMDSLMDEFLDYIWADHSDLIFHDLGIKIDTDDPLVIKNEMESNREQIKTYLARKISVARRIQGNPYWESKALEFLAKTGTEIHEKSGAVAKLLDSKRVRVSFNGKDLGTYYLSDLYSNSLGNERGRDLDSRLYSAETSKKYEEYTLAGGQDYRVNFVTVSDLDYKTPHFDKKDILAHYRTKTRLDTKGRPVFFIEEIQSDLHQAGKKKGYRLSSDQIEAEINKLKTPDFVSHLDDVWEKLNSEFNTIPSGLWERPEIKDLRSTLDLYSKYKDINAFCEELKSLKFVSLGWDSRETKNYKEVPMSSDSLKVYANCFISKVLETVNLDRVEEFVNKETEIETGNSKRVPSAPMSGTQEWAGLVLKKALTSACEEGAQSLSWTPGFVQDARYDFSDRLDQLVFFYPSLTGSKDISNFEDFPKVIISGFFRGQKVVHHVCENKAASIDEVIGFELRSRVESVEPVFENQGATRDYKGEMSQGSGQREFYDRILVRLANKLFKSMGGVVKESLVSVNSTYTPYFIFNGQESKKAHSSWKDIQTIKPVFYLLSKNVKTIHLALRSEPMIFPPGITVNSILKTLESKYPNVFITRLNSLDLPISDDYFSRKNLEGFKLVSFSYSDILGEFSTEAEVLEAQETKMVEDTKEKMKDEKYLKSIDGKDWSLCWSMEITPQMKAAVESGLYYYSGSKWYSKKTGVISSPKIEISSLLSSRTFIDLDQIDPDSLSAVYVPSIARLRAGPELPRVYLKPNGLYGVNSGHAQIHCAQDQSESQIEVEVVSYE